MPERLMGPGHAGVTGHMLVIFHYFKSNERSLECFKQREKLVQFAFWKISLAAEWRIDRGGPWKWRARRRGS